MDLRNLPSYTQEFEDENMLNLDKSPEDFLLNLSEEHYDFRRHFPSVDEDSLNREYQNINCEDVIELENKKSLFDDNNIEEDKSICVQTITKELSTSITKQINSASFIQRDPISNQKQTLKKRGWKQVQCSKVRWGKEDDKQMFNTLCRLTKQQNLNLNDICESRQLSKELKNILIQVKELHNWRGSIYVLRKRVKLILSKSFLSAREERDLKKMLRKEVIGEISMNEIFEQFPGKSETLILNFKAEYTDTLSKLKINN